MPEVSLGWYFLAGLSAGAVVGLVVAALCVAGRDSGCTQQCDQGRNCKCGS